MRVCVRRCAVLGLLALGALPSLLLVLAAMGDARPRPRRPLAGRASHQPGDEEDAARPDGPLALPARLAHAPDTQQWAAEIASRMAERREALRRGCVALGLDTAANDSLHRANPWEFFVSRPHRLVWCNVFKAASTSWMYNFNVLAGYSHKFLQSSKVVPLNLARKKYPRPSLRDLQVALNDSVSFLIVRHPLERLLSAYRDKLEYSLPHTLHQRLGTEIILKYRSNAKGARGAGVGRGRKGGSPRWPTFPEFVRFLVDERRKGRPFDMHWAPVVEFCTPCHVRFDVIAKFETLQEDQNYLIYLANLQNFIKPQWKNPAKGRTTKEVVAGYYSQLTKTQILQLYNIYKYDFELFGYTLNGYMELGIEDNKK